MNVMQAGPETIARIAHVPTLFAATTETVLQITMKQVATCVSAGMDGKGCIATKVHATQIPAVNMVHAIWMEETTEASAANARLDGMGMTAA